MYTTSHSITCTWSGICVSLYTFLFNSLRSELVSIEFSNFLQSIFPLVMKFSFPARVLRIFGCGMSYCCRSFQENGLAGKNVEYH